jgi:hypothetical protein
MFQHQSAHGRGQGQVAALPALIFVGGSRSRRAGGRRRRGGFRLGRCGGRSRSSGGATCGDGRDDRADADGVAFLHQQIPQHAGDRRRHVDRDLVGF